MDGRCAVGVRCILLGIIHVSLFQSVLTVLHRGNSNGYALPRPMIGCADHWMDYKVRLTYPNLSHSTNISEEFKLALDTLTDDMIVFEFCVQNRTTVPDETVLDWPAGKYCIHSMGRILKTDGGYEWSLGDCPRGFKPGVTALPFPSTLGQPMVDPTSPISLTYPNMTLVHYCCSTNGDVNTTIDLGMVDPFYLLPYGQAQCQKVDRMDSHLEFIEWPVAEQRWSGTHPFSVEGRKFFYCFYKPTGKGMDDLLILATVSVAIGTPTLTLLVLGLCKLRVKLSARTKHFNRF